MLAKNKCGWTLFEYLDIAESDICKYQNVTGSYVVLKINDKFLIGFNNWRNQWEFALRRYRRRRNSKTGGN